MSTVPAYLRIAADLRRSIVEGGLGPGAKLPTESDIMRVYGVSRTVAKYAINVLKDEGLVEGRRGSGVYVRSVPRLIRPGPAHDERSRPAAGAGAPAAADDAAAADDGAPDGRWEHLGSAPTDAPAGIAERLHLGPGTTVRCSRYRFLAGDEPVQLLTSWEPLEPAVGTAARAPGDGGTVAQWPDGGGQGGPVARLEARGIRVDECVERVCDRTAAPEEIEALALSLRGGRVQAVQRTYYSAGRPVETADIVLVAARYEIVYRLPIG
jgi:GntR family transcriptional regulator